MLVCFCVLLFNNDVIELSIRYTKPVTTWTNNCIQDNNLDIKDLLSSNLWPHFANISSLCSLLEMALFVAWLPVGSRCSWDLQCVVVRVTSTTIRSFSLSNLKMISPEKAREQPSIDHPTLYRMTMTTTTN